MNAKMDGLCHSVYWKIQFDPVRGGLCPVNVENMFLVVLCNCRSLSTSSEINSYPPISEAESLR